MQFFNNPTAGRLTTSDMVSQIDKFVKESPKSSYRLIIGTDSQIKKLNGKAECDYVTAIVIHRIGNGARYFWSKEKVKLAPVLRDRIYKETMISIEVANDLLPEFEILLKNAKYQFEIHIDVGSVGPTREMIKEVVGMVTGNGFVAKTKPQAWGASKVADKYT